MRSNTLSTLMVCAVLAVALAACSAEIGDECERNLDCSPNGDRICDTAQVGGYCTIQGCTYDSCPEEARCISFYPADFLVRTCVPETEDAVAPGVEATDDCLRDEICLSSGFCAQRALESRFCMLKCGEDSDCRGGYECRATGVYGAEAVLNPAKPDRTVFHFCAQRP